MQAAAMLLQQLNLYKEKNEAIAYNV